MYVPPKRFKEDLSALPPQTRVMMVKNGSILTSPTAQISHSAADLTYLNSCVAAIWHLIDNDCDIFVAELTDSADPLTKDAQHVWLPLRDAYRNLPVAHHQLCTRAVAINNWQQQHNHSHLSGEPLVSTDNPLTKQANGADHHPRIDPAIIVAVTYEDKILLGRQSRWAENRYSVVAGFVEIGETIEHAVAREVFEETGIEVDNITYFGSQPWPFPNSIMIGFQATAKSPDITLHDGELAHAAFFTRDEITSGSVKLPSSYSISYQLIEAWLQSNS